MVTALGLNVSDVSMAPRSTPPSSSSPFDLSALTAASQVRTRDATCRRRFG